VNLIAKIIDNNLTTDHFAVFFALMLALVVGILLYFQR
jgi:hypothetical protein